MFLKLPSMPHSTAAWRIAFWTTLAFAFGSALAFAVMHYLVADIMRERSDAWLGGEADVLAQVSVGTPRDALYNRMVQEVAELATQEVPGEATAQGKRLNTVFFLQTGARPQNALWVGPSAREPFVAAIAKARLAPGVPASVEVQGSSHPYRVVARALPNGETLYLGLSDRDAVRLLYRLLGRFLVVWAGMVLLGFFISFESARRILRRVERITETAAGIGSSDLSARVPEGAHHDEVARLAHTFNLMLERIQASVSQLRAVTGAVAHDLKSPVTTIRGKLEFAISHDEHGICRESVGEAIEGLDQLAEMLNTTLDLAEAEAGALQLRRRPTDFSELVQQLVELYQPAMAERRHLLTADVKPGVIVNVDTSFMHRTLTNLLDNELTHLPGGCRIRVALRAHEDRAEMLIEDDGPGFPAGLRHRAFERFVKGEQSRGHGLGLAFVEAIVQAHGGSIGIGDRPGGGAVIHLWLPLASVSAQVVGAA